jgi:hypothetical protein
MLPNDEVYRRTRYVTEIVVPTEFEDFLSAQRIEDFTKYFCGLIKDQITENKEKEDAVKVEGS